MYDYTVESWLNKIVGFDSLFYNCKVIYACVFVYTHACPFTGNISVLGTLNVKHVCFFNEVIN